MVLGDGKLGLLVAQVLHQAGARVLAVGKHDDKLAILRRRGIETTLVSAWRQTPVDVVVEATGSAAGLSMAIAATKPRGTLVLKSTVAEAVALNLAPLVINEITVVGSRCGRFAPALQALASGQRRRDVTDRRTAAAQRQRRGTPARRRAGNAQSLAATVGPAAGVFADSGRTRGAGTTRRSPKLPCQRDAVVW